MTIIPSYQGKSPDNSPSRPDKEAMAKDEKSVFDEPQTVSVTESKARKRSLVLSAQETPADNRSDNALRPQTLAEYVGQSRIKSMMQMSIVAAKGRGESLDHVLFMDRQVWEKPRSRK